MRVMRCLCHLLLQVWLLATILVAVKAFSPSSLEICRPRRSGAVLAASVPSSGSGSDDQQQSETLSGLVSGMLQAQREMAQEIKSLEEVKQQQQQEEETSKEGMPARGPDGIYRISSKEELGNLQATHDNQLVIIKFSSPMCKACRMLHQKFRHLRKKLEASSEQDAQVILADISVAKNSQAVDPFRDHVVNDMKVHRIPTIHLYAPAAKKNAAGGSHQLVDAIGCNPKDGTCSWIDIQEEILQFVDEWGGSATKATQQSRRRPQPLRFLQNRLRGFISQHR